MTLTSNEVKTPEVHAQIGLLAATIAIAEMLRKFTVGTYELDG